MDTDLDGKLVVRLNIILEFFNVAFAGFVEKLSVDIECSDGLDLFDSSVPGSVESIAHSQVFVGEMEKYSLRQGVIGYYFVEGEARHHSVQW